MTAPTLLWVKALDMVMDRLVVAGVDFSTIEALSGAAQVLHIYFYITYLLIILSFDIGYSKV